MNVQQEWESQRREEIAQRRYGLDQQACKARQERAETIKRRADRQQYQKHPELLIGESFEIYRALPAEFRCRESFWRPFLDQAINSIRKRRNPDRRHDLEDRARIIILKQNMAPIDLRYKFISIVESRMLEPGLNVTKSVTPD